MEYFFILNPASRGGKSQKRFGELFHLLQTRGIKFNAGITSGIGEAQSLSKTANAQGYKTVVAVGGDGTINNVINGFFDDKGKRTSSAKFGVIYMGTSPDFCQSYGIPLDLNSAVSALIRGRTRGVRVGAIHYALGHMPEYEGRLPGRSDNFTTRYFACCANIGIGASVARFANSGIRSYIGDFCGTFISLMISLAAYRPRNLKIIKDGVEERLTRVYNISVGKTPLIASGIKIRSQLKEGDSRFYNLAVSRMGLHNIPGILLTLYMGRPIVNGKGPCSLKYGENFEICGARQKTEVEFDGDPAGYLPCKIGPAADHLDVIVKASP